MKTTVKTTTECVGYEQPFKSAPDYRKPYDYADTGDGYDYPEADTGKSIVAGKKATQASEKSSKMDGDTEMSEGGKMGGDTTFIDV
jgi:hypothetical protein